MLEMALVFILGFVLGYSIIKILEKITETDESHLVEAGTIHILEDEDGEYPFMESGYSIEQLVRLGKVIFNVKRKDR